MADFAAAYQRERNWEWLDNVFADIVDPSQRVNCRDFGRDEDDDLVDDPDHISADERTGDLEKDARTATRDTQSPGIPLSFVTAPALSRLSSRSRIRRAQSQNSNTQGQSRSQQLQDEAKTRRLSDGTAQAVISPLSFRSETTSKSSRLYFDGTRNFDASAFSASPPQSPAPPYEHVSRPPKALSRSFSLQGWEKLGDRKPLTRQRSKLSTISQFSGFATHPAVRPLEKREVLGEAAGPADDDGAEYPGPLPLTLIIIGICLSVFIISLDRSIITTAIPEITARFHSYDDIGWYGAAYLLAASAFQPLYGRVYMTFETKMSFLAALSIFQLGSVIGATAVSSEVLIVGRAVQGLGSAGILTGSFVVGTHSVRMAHRPILFAGVGILYAVGALCGPLLGGAFTDTIGWRWCFWINLPIGGVTFFALIFCFKTRTSAKTREPFFARILSLDLVGNAIFLSAATMLFLALQFSEQRFAWSSARIVGLMCGFAVMTLIFVAWMWHKGDAALLPPKIVTQRTVAASCGAAFFIYGTTLIHAYYLPIWFQAIKGDAAITSGVNMIPYMAANALFSMAAGVFVSKKGLFAPPAIVGCAIGTIGCGLLATVKPSTSTGTWVGYEILISTGIGLAIQQGFSAVQTSLPLEYVPVGTAAVVASQSAGGAIFVTVGNTLLQNHLLNENSAHRIPGVNIRAVIELGTTQFRNHVPPEALPALVKLYNESLQAVFIAAVPLCGVAFLCSLCMEWKSVRKGDIDGKGAEVEKEKTKSTSPAESNESV